MNTLLCIDPGKSGGMALAIDGKYVDSWAMPETEGDIVTTIKDLANGAEGQAVCVIESVHAMPKQGVSSTFTFGRGYGFLLGVLMSHKFRVETITPQRWQKPLGIGKSDGKTEHKNKLKAKAQQLYPNAKVTLKTADALLMLDHALRANGGHL